MGGSAAGRGGRVVFAGTLVYAMAIAAYTQFLLGVLAPLITEDLGMSRTQLGGLTTAIFIVGGVGAPLVGPVVDRVGGRRVLALLFVVGGVSWVSMGLAPTFAVLLVASALAGFVRGASNPVGNQLVLRHAEPAGRGLLMGLSKSGAHVGSFIVGLTVPAAAAAVGWRGVAVGSAVLSVIGLLLTFGVIPPDESRAELAERSKARLSAGDRQLLWWLGAHAALIGFGIGPLNAYVPLFAVERLGMSVAEAGVVVSGVAAAAIVARILWGRQADRFGSPQSPLILVAMLGAVSYAFLALAAVTDGPLLLWIGAIGYSLSTGSWISVGMVVLIREVRLASTGRVSGLVLGFFYGGFAISPVLFGFVVDRTGSYALAWSMGWVAFLGAALVALVWRRSQRTSVQRRAPVGADAPRPEASARSHAPREVTDPRQEPR